MKLLQLLPLVLLVHLTCSCDRKTAAEEIGYGSVVNGVYKNDYLGFEIEIPDSWTVQTQAEIDAVSKEGAEFLMGDSEEAKELLEAAEQQTVNLLFLTEHPLDAMVEENRNIVVLAESLKMAPMVKNGRDYYTHMKRNLDLGQANYTILKENFQETVGGKAFDCMDMQLDVVGIKIQQRFYARKVKDYMLAMVITYVNDDQPLRDILDTAKVAH